MANTFLQSIAVATYTNAGSVNVSYGACTNPSLLVIVATKEWLAGNFTVSDGASYTEDNIEVGAFGGTGRGTVGVYSRQNTGTGTPTATVTPSNGNDWGCAKGWEIGGAPTSSAVAAVGNAQSNTTNASMTINTTGFDNCTIVAGMTDANGVATADTGYTATAPFTGNNSYHTAEGKADVGSGGNKTLTFNGSGFPYVMAGVAYKTTPSASCALSGTLGDGATKSQIVAGGQVLVLTMTNDTFVASGGTFNAIRQDIIDGLVSAGAETHGWNNDVLPALAVTDVVRTSATVVTITLPAVASYAISADETITVTVPATALVGGIAVVADTTFTVTDTVISSGGGPLIGGNRLIPI